MLCCILSEMATAPPNSEDALPEDLTLLLTQMQRGDHRAGEKAVALVYSELHRIASRELRGERPDHLLQTTALIHEAYTRLIGSEALEIQNRIHFFAVASQQMRRILIDYARARNAQRRGGGAVSLGLDEVQAGINPRSVDLLSLDEALRELERIDPRAANVVELRFFGGYTDQEVGEALGVSLATIRRDWEFARSWLFDRMKGEHNRYS
jgi:RNA polymerase sigma factor (TIGR02999 family)